MVQLELSSAGTNAVRFVVDPSSLHLGTLMVPRALLTAVLRNCGVTTCGGDSGDERLFPTSDARITGKGSVKVRSGMGGTFLNRRF